MSRSPRGQPPRLSARGHALRCAARTQRAAGKVRATPRPRRSPAGRLDAPREPGLRIKFDLGGRVAARAARHCVGRLRTVSRQRCRPRCCGFRHKACVLARVEQAGRHAGKPARGALVEVEATGLFMVALVRSSSRSKSRCSSTCCMPYGLRDPRSRARSVGHTAPRSVRPPHLTLQERPHATYTLKRVVTACST
jgi:hypothetical protein